MTHSWHSSNGSVCDSFPFNSVLLSLELTLTFVSTAVAFSKRAERNCRRVNDTKVGNSEILSGLHLISFLWLLILFFFLERNKPSEKNKMIFRCFLEYIPSPGNESECCMSFSPTLFCTHINQRVYNPVLKSETWMSLVMSAEHFPSNIVLVCEVFEYLFASFLSGISHWFCQREQELATETRVELQFCESSPLFVTSIPFLSFSSWGSLSLFAPSNTFIEMQIYQSLPVLMILTLDSLLCLVLFLTDQNEES